MEVIDAGLQTTCLLFISHHQAKIKDLKYFLQFYSTASVVCRMNKQEAKKRIGEEKKAKTWKKMGRIGAEKSRGLGAAMSTRHCSTSSASASGSGTPLDRSLPASSPLSLSFSALSALAELQQRTAYSSSSSSILGPFFPSLLLSPTQTQPSRSSNERNPSLAMDGIMSLPDFFEKLLGDGIALHSSCLLLFILYS